MFRQRLKCEEGSRLIWMSITSSNSILTLKMVIKMNAETVDWHSACIRHGKNTGDVSSRNLRKIVRGNSYGRWFVTNTNFCYELLCTWRRVFWCLFYQVLQKIILFAFCTLRTSGLTNIEGVCWLQNIRFFRPIRKIAKSECLALSCVSITSFRPHGTSRLPLDEFAWNLIFEYLPKIYRTNSSFIKIWQQ